MQTRGQGCGTGRRTVQWLAALLIIAGLSGCAVAPPSTPATVSTAQGNLPAGEGWWYARFHIARPDEDDTQWHIGTLLGGEVIAPLFDQHPGDILIWRIHRRAPRDENGHVFSLVFYSSAAGAQRVYSTIDANPVLARLLRDGRVSKVGFDDIERIRRPGVADTSDRNWPEVVQHTWPALAMGASRMWLDTVSLLAAEQADDVDLEQRYRQVNREVSKLWAEQGQHAVLHHLFAIYAYEPILVRY